jgi:hypothetical protein
MIKNNEESSDKGKNARYVIVSIIALIVGLFYIWLNIALLGADARYFIDLPSLYLLLIPIIFVLTITRSYKLFFFGLKTLIFSKIQISEEKREQTIGLFRLMTKTVAISSAIITIIFLVSMFLNMDFTSVDFMYIMIRNISTMLIVPLYCLIMILVIFEPIVFILKKK